MKIIKPCSRYLFLSAFMTAGIGIASAPVVAADLFGSGLGAAVNGQVGVSTHINNTPVYAPLGTDIDARNLQRYRSDAQERTIRQRATTAVFQDMSIAPADIAPAAGQPYYIRRTHVYDMGGIQGGHSYND